MTITSPLLHQPLRLIWKHFPTALEDLHLKCHASPSRGCLWEYQTERGDAQIHALGALPRCVERRDEPIQPVHVFAPAIKTQSLWKQLAQRHADKDQPYRAKNSQDLLSRSVRMVLPGELDVA